MKPNLHKIVLNLRQRTFWREWAKEEWREEVGAGEHIPVDLFKERQAAKVSKAGHSERDAGVTVASNRAAQQAEGLGTDVFLLKPWPRRL